MAGGKSWRLAFVAAFAFSAVAWADGQDASTNAPATNEPAASTNAPSADVPATNAPAADAIPPAPDAASSTNSPASFIESHPELTQPVPNSTGSLSLRPDTSTTNAPPEVTPSGSEIFKDVPQVPLMAQSRELADHLLVVYNKNDPDSGDLANYYASKRKIPDERVLGISCPTGEEISRGQYDDTIRSPIIAYLCQKNWMARASRRARIGNRYMDVLVATHNDIWAIVLMRGVPLKIAPDPSDQDGMEPEPELQTNAAAVDNELALLPVFGLPKGGYIPNGFFDDQLAGIKHACPELAVNMVFVTRLDGPTPADVHRMIDDTISAETNRLAGLAVVDTRGFTDVKNGYTVGDVWLRSARDMLLNDGWAIKFDDSPDTIPATDPLNHVAIYLGWYHEGVIGPWTVPPDRFVPGAIAYHLHSFSAVTVRDPTVGWVGPLIAHGADATMGMVYEPYLIFTPHEDIFTRRLLQGDYFAEAAYASERALSWMMTVVGDPLYRPFHQPLSAALADTGLHHTEHDDWLLLQRVRREFGTGVIAGTSAALTRALDVPGAGPIVQEGLGDLLSVLNDPAAPPEVEKAYRKAQAEAIAPIDQVRIGLKLAQYYSNHGKEGQAQTELAALRDKFPEDAKRFGVPGQYLPTSLTPPRSRW